MSEWAVIWMVLGVALIVAGAVTFAAVFFLNAGHRMSRWQGPIPSRAEVGDAITKRPEPPKEPPPEPFTGIPMYAVNPGVQP